MPIPIGAYFPLTPRAGACSCVHLRFTHVACLETSAVRALLAGTLYNPLAAFEWDENAYTRYCSLAPFYEHRERLQLLQLGKLNCVDVGNKLFFFSESSCLDELQGLLEQLIALAGV